jgi:hypothetical protein
MLIRFWKSFKFYIKHVGLKNTIFVEIPNFINNSRYSKIDGIYKMNSNLKERFEDLVEEMEDSQEYYIG